jgi:hypothetical protein
VLLSAFHRPLRIATAMLVLAGVALAAIGTTAALIHHSPGPATSFIIVALTLTCAAALLIRGNRWIIAITVVALGGQWIAVAATTWELIRGIAPIKSRQLHDLGFNPTAGVTINLIFSTIAGLLFTWFAIRYFNIRANAR